MRRALALTLAAVIGLVAPVGAQDAAPGLRAAWPMVSRGDWSGARAAAARDGAVAADLVDWLRLARGGDFADVADLKARHPDWPGISAMAARVEGDLPYLRRPQSVVDFFADSSPGSAAGALALAAAHQGLAQPDAAAEVARDAWRRLPMTLEQQNAIWTRYGPLLRDEIPARLDALLWDGEEASVRALWPMLSEDDRALAAARLALKADRPGVDDLIEAVPSARAGDPGLTYERFAWRMRHGLRPRAADLMLEQAGALGQPERWARARRSLVREAMRAGEGARAYALATDHGLTEGSSFADLEWLAGYVALRFLDDPARAEAHFRAFDTAVVTPISRGRAGYWLGRALEAQDKIPEARAAYADGARWQTSFYGQLAAERLRLPLDGRVTGADTFPGWRDDPMTQDSRFIAARLLYAAGNPAQAERFATALARDLAPHQLGQLADMALDDWQDPHIALRLAKVGASRGMVLGRAYLPVVAMGAGHPDVPPEIALAIARQESEFDPAVSSHVGAQGLMQLMPGTAEEMARRLGLAYDRARLTSDPAYNAALGTGYLARLTGRFGPNLILVPVGYNAGPGRANQWRRALGDPVEAEVDVVDWIEAIPFDETRNYVMRVSEGAVAYRARLYGTQAEVGLLDMLKAGKIIPPTPDPRARPEDFAAVMSREEVPVIAPSPDDPPGLW